MSAVVLINISDERWKNIDNLSSRIERVVKKACYFCDNSQTEKEVSLLLADDKAIRELNKIYRGKDKPTNVLSFPSSYPDKINGPILLGDIILSYETVLQESIKDKKPHLDHITHLLVHGVLHLYGFDHEDEPSASKMEATEISILKELGVSNPYLVKP